ncbi:MAG: VanZ family protein [Ignavibacteriales bacterium]|nr:VanZ family protein [Ignavibacteriales bacterium]
MCVFLYRSYLYDPDKSVCNIKSEENIISTESKISFRKKVQYWFPAFLWIGFIFWMSTGIFSAHNTYLFFVPLLRFFSPSISQKEIIVVHFIIRKLAHVTEYFISGLLLFRAFRNGSDKQREWLWAFSSFFVVVMIAASDELHQSFVYTRTASFADVGIDILGGFLAQCASVLIYRRHRQ